MIFLILGSIIVLLTMRDVFQVVLVPRRTSHTMSQPLVRKLLWPAYRFVFSKVPSSVWRAEILGVFAPLVLVFLLAIWVSFLSFGFGLILMAFARETSPPIESFPTAMYVAGSQVLTIGSDYAGKTTVVRFLMMTAAFCGLIITASVLSLVFTLIGSIQRREVMVSVTSSVAGSPPSGIAILERYAVHDESESLYDFYHDWHMWCADVVGTHRAYPILLFFRSADRTSWFTAIGAALDSAALLLSTCPDGACLAAKVMFESARALINELCTHWKLDSSGTPEVSVEEVNMIYERLQKAGYTTPSEAKDTFIRLRQQYIGAHRAICDYIAVPQTPLLTDRQHD